MINLNSTMIATNEGKEGARPCGDCAALFPVLRRPKSCSSSFFFTYTTVASSAPVNNHDDGISSCFLQLGATRVYCCPVYISSRSFSVCSRMQQPFFRQTARVRNISKKCCMCGMVYISSSNTKKITLHLIL